MIEDLLCDMVKPQRAIELLIIFLYEYLYDDISTTIEYTSTQKVNDISSIIYAINLVNNDIKRLREEYYLLMSKEKYEKK